MNRFTDTITCWVSHFCNDTHHSTCKTFIMTLNRPKIALKSEDIHIFTRQDCILSLPAELISSRVLRQDFWNSLVKGERSEQELLTSFDKKGEKEARVNWTIRWERRDHINQWWRVSSNPARVVSCLSLRGGGLRREAFNLTWTVMSCLWMGGVDGNSLWQSV